MPHPIEEGLMNRLTAELCSARAEEAAAVDEAHKLADEATVPYSHDRMKAFCIAGDKMRTAHARKMQAWDRVRNAVAPPGFALDNYGNAVPKAAKVA